MTSVLSTLSFSWSAAIPYIPAQHPRLQSGWPQNSAQNIDRAEYRLRRRARREGEP